MSHKHGPHGKPITRREFLAAGLIEVAGLAMAPTLLGMLCRSQSAQAAGTLPRFMVLDMAGGMALPRNFMVGGPGGPLDLLPSYFSLGLQGAPASLTFETRFGLPMPSTSPFLAGLLATTTAAAQGNIRFGSFCHKSVDDTPSNQTSAILLVAQLLQGSHVSIPLGNRASASGGYTGVPESVSALRPLTIESATDLIKAVRLNGQTAAQQSLWAKAVERLASAQGDRYRGRLNGAEFIERFGALSRQNDAVTAATLGLDPRSDTLAQSLFGITPSTDATAPEAIKAAIVLNALRGISGPGCLFKGGYDYHAGGFDESPQDLARDRSVGEDAGRIFQMAHALGVPVMVQFITDGGSVFDVRSGVYRPVGDGGDKGMTVVGIYDPRGPREMIRTQVGNYTAGQSANLRSLIGSDEVRVAHGVLANYLNFAGRLGEYSKIGKGTLNNAELDQVLLFG